MMDKEMCGLNRYFLVVVMAVIGAGIFSGCFTKHRQDKWLQAVAEQKFTAELSSSSVIDAGILVVQLKSNSKTPVEKIVGRFNEIHFPVFEVAPGVYQGVIGVPLDTAEGNTHLVISWKDAGGEGTQEIPFAVVSGKYPVEQLQVEPKQVDPPASAMPRIKREQAEIGAVYRRFTQKKLWAGRFIKPIDSPPTSVFGTKRVYNGKKKSPHMGLDLKAAVGTPVLAAAGGIVVYAKNTYFLGGSVLIDHGYGIFTIYGHLEELHVKVGQEVKAGEKIADSGATGRVTGPHLHWGVQLNGVKVNPIHLTEAMK